MITPLTYVRFSPPVTLRLSFGRQPGGPVVTRTIEQVPLTIQIDAARREMRATLPPISRPLMIYGADDFQSACSDTMEDHAARVLDMLGSDPGTALQALIDDPMTVIPMPQRVPREIQNWRARAILATMGKLAEVEAALAALDEPQRTVVGIAWASGANLARRGPTVLSLAPQLGMTQADVDALFIAAAALQV